MARRVALLAAWTVGLTALLGCHWPKHGPAWAGVVIAKEPVQVVDTSVGFSKVGEARWLGIAFVARGDASISAAMKDGDITRIHHIDREQTHVLGVYTEEIIRVYGE